MGEIPEWQNLGRGFETVTRGNGLCWGIKFDNECSAICCIVIRGFY